MQSTQSSKQIYLCFHDIDRITKICRSDFISAVVLAVLVTLFVVNFVSCLIPLIQIEKLFVYMCMCEYVLPYGIVVRLVAQKIQTRPAQRTLHGQDGKTKNDIFHLNWNLIAGAEHISFVQNEVF